MAVALSACSEPYRGFVLDGKIQGADNELLYLYYTDSLGVWSKDSVAVKEGKIQFPGRDNGADDSFSLLGRRADGYG